MHFQLLSNYGEQIFKLRLGALIPRSVGLSVCRSVRRSVCWSVGLSVDLSVGLSVDLSVGLSSKNYKKKYRTLQNLLNHSGHCQQQGRGLAE